MALKGFKNEHNNRFSNADGDARDGTKADDASSLLDGMQGVASFQSLSSSAAFGGDYIFDVYDDGQYYIFVPRLGEYGITLENISFYVFDNLRGTSIAQSAIFSDQLQGFAIEKDLITTGGSVGFSSFTLIIQAEGLNDVATAPLTLFSDNPFTGSSNNDVVGSLGIVSSALVVSNTESGFAFNLKQGAKDDLIGNGVSLFTLSIKDKANQSVEYYFNDSVRVADLPLDLDPLTSPNGGDIAVVECFFPQFSDEPSKQVETLPFNYAPQQISTKGCLDFVFLWKDFDIALEWYGNNLTAVATYETYDSGSGQTNPSGLTGSVVNLSSSMIAINDFSLLPLAPSVSLTGNVSVSYYEDGELMGNTPSSFVIDVSNCPQVSDPTPTETIRGCTNPAASNYDPAANSDDGSCVYAEQTEPEEPTEPIDYSVEDTILDSVSTADEYGNLIDDTILVIQQLQTQLDEAIASGGASSAQVAELEGQLLDANSQLEALTGTEGIIANLESYILLAEAGNYNGELGNFGGSTQGITNVGVLNTALQTISDNVGILATAQQELSTANNLLDSIALNLGIVDNATINSEIDALQSTAALYDPTAVSLVDYNAAMEDAAEAQQIALSELNVELQAQITAIIEQNVLDTAALEAAHDLAIANLQAEWDALGLVWTQAELDLAVENAENNITPEDGVTAADVSAAEAVLQAIIDQMFTQDDLDAAEIAATEAAEAAAADAAADLAAITAAAEADFLSQIATLEGQLITDADGNVVTQGGYDGLLSQLSEAAQALITLQGEIDTAAGSTPVSSTNVDIQNLINAAQSEATAAAQIIDAAGGVVDQTAYNTLVGAYDDLNTAFDTLEGQYNTLLDEGVSDDAAYAAIEEQLDNAEAALGQAEANNAAYTAFIESLTGDLSRLEAFLVDNYNYTPYQSSSISVQSGNMPIGLSTNEDGTPNAQYLAQQYVPQFAGGGRGAATGLTPRNQVFVNFRGYANYVKDGFAKFQGQAPKSSFMRADGDDESNELTKTTKTGLQILGVAVGGFILYKLLGKK